MEYTTKSRKLFLLFNNVLMLVIMLVTLYPLLYVLSASLSEPSEFMKHSGLLFWPLDLNWMSYKAVFENDLIINGFVNTILILVLGVALNMLLTMLGAYFFSRKGILLKKFFMFLVVFTMYFSGGLVPFYLTVRNLGLFDSLWAVILPVAVSTYNLIILRTAFDQIPESLEESAMIDGANDWVILMRIIVPLSKAPMAVIALYYAVGHWNSWFNAMIFLSERSLYPLQLVLREILLSNETNSMIGNTGISEFSGVSITIRYAVCIVATLPILFLYPFLQKYFVKGVMIGAIKG